MRTEAALQEMDGAVDKREEQLKQMLINKHGNNRF